MGSAEYWAAFAALPPREQRVMRLRHPPLSGNHLMPWDEVARAMGAFEWEVQELYARALVGLGVPEEDARDSNFGALGL